MKYLYKIGVKSSMDVRKEVKWTPLFAGALVAIAVLLLFGTFIIALDMSFGLMSRFTFALWTFLLSMIAIFLGGWTTSHTGNIESPGQAILSGIMLWGLMAIFLLYFSMNNVTILGFETILGIPLNEIPLVRSVTAWWAFVGAFLSMIMAIAGTLSGMQAGSRKDRMIRKDRSQETTNHHQPVHDYQG